MLTTKVATFLVIAAFVLGLRSMWTGNRSWIILTYTSLMGVCSVIGIVRLLGFG